MIINKYQTKVRRVQLGQLPINYCPGNATISNINAQLSAFHSTRMFFDEFKICLVEQVSILLSPACKHPTQAKIVLGFSFIGNVNPNKQQNSFHCKPPFQALLFPRLLPGDTSVPVWHFFYLVATCKSDLQEWSSNNHIGFFCWVQYLSWAQLCLYEQVFQNYYPVTTLLRYPQIILPNSHFTTLFILTDVKARTRWIASWKLVLISVWEYILLTKNTLEARMFSKQLVLACSTMKIKICFSVS